jgi:hypothetical protein
MPGAKQTLEAFIPMASGPRLKQISSVLHVLTRASHLPPHLMPVVSQPTLQPRLPHVNHRGHPCRTTMLGR